MDRTLGLDLFLHTPGGDIAATESLVHYLKEMFGNNIRAVIPQMAMSAGAMLACSCSSILMGKHSNIGPVDPQINGIPAIGVIEELAKAYEEIKNDQRAALVWNPILSRLPPSFVQQCYWAIERSGDFLKQTLQDLVLTVHHCFMNTLANTAAFKAIEDHRGRATIKLHKTETFNVPIPQNFQRPPANN